jgi:plastocyanin
MCSCGSELLYLVGSRCANVSTRRSAAYIINWHAYLTRGLIGKRDNKAKGGLKLMANESATTTLSPGDKVRFTAERLSVLTPPDRKRLEGRVGIVQGRRNNTRKLTVYFPEDGARPELRILSLEPSQLERVVEEFVTPDVPPDSAELAGAELSIEEASRADTASTEVANTEATSGGDKLSQEELDKLFD